MVRPAKAAAGNDPGWRRGASSLKTFGRSDRFTSTFSIGFLVAEIPIGF
jgi:hypothetical protein